MASYIFDGTPHQTELERLRALEDVFDAGTRRCLPATGLRTGWKCLEVGAGAGSIAHWLAETVGPAGRVLAVDTNPRFLMGVGHPLEVMEADIRTAALEPESFDLAHARFVLIHVPGWEEALAAMIRCLKPGGRLVLEEPDFACSRAFAGPRALRCAFDNVRSAIEAMLLQGGMDPAFGARLPALLPERGIEELSLENDSPIVPGGSPHAKMMALSTFQLREKYIATGLAGDGDISLYGDFAADPTCWAIYHGTIRTSGRRIV